jgi:two-component system, NarL family, sensor histidine kinase UhpB
VRRTPKQESGARSEEEARGSQRLVRQVLETLPVGVAVLDRDGNIILNNPASARIWGAVIRRGQERYARSIGRHHGSGRPVAPGEWGSQRALRAGETTLNELIDIDAFDGRRRIIQNSAAPLLDGRGEIVGAVVVNDDVTERVAAEEALRKTQRLLVEAERLGETGSWEQDLLTGEIVNSEENRRLFFGDDRGKGERFEDYAEAVHPADRDWVIRRRTQLLAGEGRPDIEFRVVWPEGSVHDIFGLATVVRDAAGCAVRVYGTNADITRRKRAEDEVARRREELQVLSRKLIEAQEAERRAVARELHDDFGQVLTAIKLNLTDKERDQAETIALVDGAIARVRDLAHNLRPSMLDDLGLSESLRWYVDREARRAGLEAHLEIATIEGRLPPTIETTCFRVTQEALTNVIRHARARRIEVELRSSPDGLRLEVRDDGGGFDPAAARGDSQGLLGMRERVALAGGELEVDSAPGRGTAVRARFPSVVAG